MKIKEVKTPFEKHRFLTYNSKGDKVVYHNIEVQKIFHNIYKGKNEGGEYNEYCDIYVLYDGDSVGIKIHSVNTDYHVEDMVNKIKGCLLHDKPSYITRLKNMIKNNMYVQMAEIQFARYVAPELVDGLITARENRIRIQKEASKRLEEERKHEAELRAQKDNEDAKREVEKLVEKIKNGGVFENTEITIHNGVGDGVVYTTIVYLMEKNGINIPIRTKGWIMNNAESFTFSGGKCVSIRYIARGKGKGKGSVKALDYINELAEIIIAEG